MKYKGICFAIEDENTEVVELESPAIPAEVVADVAEVETAEGEASDMGAAGDEAGEDLETLEEIRDVMSDSVESGEGVDQPAAAIAEIAVESICRRLGMKKVTFIPAMESFGSKNNRVAATRVAVEGITETIKNGWKQLIEWLKKTWASIVEYFKKMFDTNLKLAKAAEEMKGKVAALADDAKAVKGEEIENKSLASTFSAGAVETMKGLVKLTTNSEKAFGVVVGLAKDLEKSAANLSTSGKLMNTVDMADATVGELKKQLSEVPGAKKALGNDGAFTVSIAGYKIGFAGGASKEGVGVALIWEKLPEAATKVKTLSKSDMGNVVSEVLELTKATSSYKEVYGKLEEINKISIAVVSDVLKGLEKLSKAAAEGKSESTEGLVKARKDLTKTNSILSSLGAKLPALNVSTGKAGLEYVGLSLKQYKAD